MEIESQRTDLYKAPVGYFLEVLFAAYAPCPHVVDFFSQAAALKRNFLVVDQGKLLSTCTIMAGVSFFPVD